MTKKARSLLGLGRALSRALLGFGLAAYLSPPPHLVVKVGVLVPVQSYWLSLIGR